MSGAGDQDWPIPDGEPIDPIDEPPDEVDDEAQLRRLRKRFREHPHRR
jgi:hypothetical protein